MEDNLFFSNQTNYTVKLITHRRTHRQPDFQIAEERPDMGLSL